MNYYTLGKTGLRVTRLCLGTMTFGKDWGWGTEESASGEIFDHYLEAGGNFLDTADLYTNGSSERILGKLMKDRKVRDKVVLATKFTFNAEPGNPNAGGNGRKNMMRAVEGSLKRLRTEYIDLYIMHAWDQLTPAEEVMRAFDDLISSGKIRYVGLSDVPAWYAARAQSIAELRGYERVSSIQLEYSLLERNIEHEFVPMGQETGTGITAWSPLAGGILSGKYRTTHSGVKGEGRQVTIQNHGEPVANRFSPKNLEILSTLEGVANELGKSMAQVALNWVANRPGVASILIGATKMKQLEDNLAALSFEIPSELLKKLNTVSAPPVPFPYTFFQNKLQQTIAGGTSVGPKPPHYTPKLHIPKEKSES